MRLHLTLGVSALLLLSLIVNADMQSSSPSTIIGKRGWRKYVPFAARRPATPSPVSSWDTTSSSHHSSPQPPPRAQTPVLSTPESPSPPRGRSPTSPLLLSPPRPSNSPLFIPHSFRSHSSSSSSTSSSTPPRSTWHLGESSSAASSKRKGLWASIKDTLGGKRRRKD